MKKKNQWIAILVTASLGLQLFVPGGSDTALAAKKGAINRKKLTLKVGQKKKLKVKRVKGKIKWSSNRKRVAAVSAKGVVTAKKAGKAVITARVRGKKYKCRVTVKTKGASGQPGQSITPAAPETSGAAMTTEKPTQSIHPDRPVPSNQSETPTETEAPGQSAKPVGTETPGQSEGPTGTEAPGQSAKPKETGAPGQSEGPAGTEVPGQSTEPLDTQAPDETPIPTEKPGQSAAPDVTELESVLFSQEGGVYEKDFTLTLSNASESAMYYTLDGTDPRTSSTRKRYQDGIDIRSRSGDANVLSAISPDRIATMNSYVSGKEIKSRNEAPYSSSQVDKCSVVRAVAIDEEGRAGRVVTNTYFIGKMSDHIRGIAQSAAAAGRKLAVMSITVDPEDLLDEEKGIYVRGKYFEDSLQEYLSKHNNTLDGINVEHDLTSNFKQRGREWERSCHIEYFESDGTDTACELKQDCGIRIQGNYSREHIQKSFRLYARDDYGTKNFRYPFFEELLDADGGVMDKFKTLVLRNGGNDVENYKYKDILTQSFVHDLEVETHCGRPCVVYLDGEYWGYYVLQDDLSDNYLQQRRGVVKENVVAYKGTDDPRYSAYSYKLDEGDLPEGVTQEDYYLRDTLDYLRNHDLSKDTCYQEFIGQFVSEQSALDYFAATIFLNDGYDWPYKNWEIWRVTQKDETNPFADGRWRFCLFDLDLTTEPTWITDEGSANHWCRDTVSNLYDRGSSNVIKMIFSNMLENASFRQKLDERIREMGTRFYPYETVSERAEQYKAMYSPLHEQFLSRYVLYSSYTAKANHEMNLKFYERRMGYVPEMLEGMHQRFSG